MIRCSLIQPFLDHLVTLQLTATCVGFLEASSGEFRRVCICRNDIKDEISFTLIYKLSIRSC